MFTEEDYTLINRDFESLRGLAKDRCTNEDHYQLILKAFDFANEAHKDVRRRSGEPYILHPIAVAKIVVSEIGLGYKSICAALLHDVVEDTDYTVDDIRDHFGDKIATLVDGLTKIKTALDNDNKSEVKSLQAENFKRILLTLNDDVRIVLIKLADRLHNCRTIQYMPDYKRDKILSETMYIFIPLANRLGLYSIKTEMENIWLQWKEPNDSAEITKKLDSIKQESENSMNYFISPIKAVLRDKGFSFDIIKRLKTPYSIWKKMVTKNIPFEEIYDICAIRIIFEPQEGVSEREQCWQIFSAITELYSYKPERTRDWLKDPKSNGYEALHLTVMGPHGNWIEVQIRSDRMNSIAERGVAAHWLYKKYSGETYTYQSENEVDTWLKKIKDVLEHPDANTLQFLDDFHKELTMSEIFVFTPKGEARSVPKHATALDFAYSIHSHIGHKAIAAKVNQRLVPLSHELTNGDQVEIITSEKGVPKREWLDFLITAKARNAVIDKIKSDSKNNLKEGRALLESKLNEVGVPVQTRVIKKLQDYYKATTKDELYIKIGCGLIDLNNLETILKTNIEKRNVQMWGVKLLEPTKIIGKINRKEDYLLSEDITEGTMSFSIAPCCSPIPGDSVVCFIDDDGSVVVHKKSCEVANRLASKYGNKIVPAKWSKHFMMSYLAGISIKGIDRIGILSEVTKSLAMHLGINIRKILIEAHDEIFEGTIELYVHNTDDLGRIIDTLKEIKGIEMVKRNEISNT